MTTNLIAETNSTNCCCVCKTGPGLDTAALTEELDKCLLTDDELAQKLPRRSSRLKSLLVDDSEDGTGGGDVHWRAVPRCELLPRSRSPSCTIEQRVSRLFFQTPIATVVAHDAAARLTRGSCCLAQSRTWISSPTSSRPTSPPRPKVRPARRRRPAWPPPLPSSRGSAAPAAPAAASPTWRHSHLVMTTDRREAREIVREPRFCWRSEIC